MFRTWAMAVLWLTKSASAISRLDRPSASGWTTSSSRGERPCAGAGSGGAGSGASAASAKTASASASASSGGSARPAAQAAAKTSSPSAARALATGGS